MIIKNGILFEVEQADINGDGTFIIPDSVTSIGKCAFYGCHNLISIIIPNTVTSIDNFAFAHCSGLTRITIGYSVTSIGDGAFRSCRRLTSMIIPDSVTSIGYGAFSCCSSLKSITIPNNMTSLCEGSFYNFSGLKSIEIPERVTRIGADVFTYCSRLKRINIPNSIISIGQDAFRECRGLTSKKSIYKAFNITKSGKLKCKNKIYIPDKWHSVNGDLELCENGIHYCTNLFEIFNYYYGELDEDIAIYECEVKGEDLHEEDSSKHCCRWLKPVKRLSREDVINLLNGVVE